MLNVTILHLQIEFGVNVTTKEVVLADVIDNDSWRLWPAGDRSQQKDKQASISFYFKECKAANRTECVRSKQN